LYPNFTVAWHAELRETGTASFYSFAPLEYQDVNGTVLMNSIHLAARRALDGEVLLKQGCEAAVDSL